MVGQINRRTRRWNEFSRPRAERITIKKPTKNRHATRLVVRPWFGATVGDELLLLAGLEVLKNERFSLSLEYATERPEVYELLDGAWFLSRAHRIAGDTEFERLVGDDLSITVEEPEITRCIEAEKALYDQKFAAEMARMEALQASYEERGMKDLRAPMPDYAFQPSWHKGNGWLWQMTQELGIPITYPEKALVPYGRVPSRQRRALHAELIRRGIGNRPFYLHDLAEDPDAVPILSTFSGSLGLDAVSTLEIEEHIGPGLAPLLVAVSNPHCYLVAGKDEPLLYSTWSVGRESCIQFYTGVNPVWDAIRMETGFTLPRNQTSTEELTNAIRTAISYLTTCPTYR